jgi:hypothetical protein
MCNFTTNKKSSSAFLRIMAGFTLFMCTTTRVVSQSIFFNNYNNGAFYSLDLQTCQSTLVLNSFAYNDIAVAPGPFYYSLFISTLQRTHTFTGVTTPIVTVPDIPTALEYGADGQIYMVNDRVYRVNPVTGSYVTLGPLPNGWVSLGDMVYMNGVYYLSVADYAAGVAKMVSVNISNPLLSTEIINFPFPNPVGAAAVYDPDCPKLYWFNSSFTDPNDNSEVYEYNINFQTFTQVCPGFAFYAGGGDTQNDYSFPMSCQCTTNAGTIAPGATINACVGAPVTIPQATNAILDPNDAFQYILSSNLADLDGSIIVRSNTPSFTFNPATMQLGVPYYISAIAGNNVGGNVSLTDFCFDISTGSRSVIWRPRPTITYSSTTGNLCAGTCSPLAVSLTGTPPFSLTYATGIGPNATSTFSTNNATLQVCIPANAPLGSINLQSVSLSDQYCTCPN